MNWHSIALASPSRHALALPSRSPRAAADWFNVWQLARILGSAPTADYDEEELRGLTPDAAKAEAAAPRARTPRLPVHVVLLDGHNASPMDDGWRALVLSVNYVKHFEGPACFVDAAFAPYG